MASWMIHFRIADGIIDNIKDVDVEKFIVGNIAPDCGELNEDGKSYKPLKYITHWKNPQNKKESLKEEFFSRYLSYTNINSKTSFYLGYYIHLVTDILWKEHIYIPTKEKYLSSFNTESELNNKIKADWGDVDHLFLRDNPDFRVLKIFKGIKTFPNVYFDYYSNTIFDNKIKEISTAYKTLSNNLNREFPFLNRQQADEFVVKAVKEIKADLVAKKLFS
jgi:hypothetical protein